MEVNWTLMLLTHGKIKFLRCCIFLEIVSWSLHWTLSKTFFTTSFQTCVSDHKHHTTKFHRPAVFWFRGRNLIEASQNLVTWNQNYLYNCISPEEGEELLCCSFKLEVIWLFKAAGSFIVVFLRAYLGFLCFHSFQMYLQYQQSDSINIEGVKVSTFRRALKSWHSPELFLEGLIVRTQLSQLVTSDTFQNFSHQSLSKMSFHKYLRIKKEEPYICSRCSTPLWWREIVW